MPPKTPPRNNSSFTLNQARELARTAHAGQVDKLGVDYFEHVEAVAAGLVDFDIDIQIAAMLHDAIEDSDLTLEDLRAEGVSNRSLVAIELVSRNLHPNLAYQEAIARICTSRDATLVKIADNAHNSRPDRVAALLERTGQGPNPRYAEARSLLYTAVPAIDVKKILIRTAPSLRRAIILSTLDQLLEYAEVKETADLAGWVDPNRGTDVSLAQEGEAITLGTGGISATLNFPMTVGDFWEKVHQCENRSNVQRQSRGI
ncbi:hypothetical protein GCM10027020_32520 [Nocardioides salsibiostraticola]